MTDDLSRGPAAGDEVITGALIRDHWGVVKADVGIRDGRVVTLGKAGTRTSWTASAPAW